MLSLRAFRELGEDLAGEAPTWRFKGNYSGIGIIQNMADGIKAITKELIIPNKADKFLFSMGPIIFISSSVFLSEKKGDIEIGIGSRLPLVISISTSEKLILGFKII